MRNAKLVVASLLLASAAAGLSAGREDEVGSIRSS
jgi:hypothetical protein